MSMKAIQAIEQFKKDLRDFGAAQFGTDNMRTTQACIEAITTLSVLQKEMQAEAVFDAEWPSVNRGVTP
jgi:hypothetical protein